MIKNIHHFVFFVLTVVASFWEPSYISANEKMIELTVEGKPGQAFKGECFLLQKSGKTRRHRIQGASPTKFWLPARAIRCILQKKIAAGTLILTVVRDGKPEFVQRSRSPLRVVSIASKGPWGAATGGVSASRSGLTK